MSYLFFPVPRKAIFENQKYNYSCATWIKIDPTFSDRLKKAVLNFVNDLRNHFPEELKLTSAKTNKGLVLIDIRVDYELRKQEYKLVSKKTGIMLTAGDESAVYYALQTLKQLLSQSGVCVPEMMIDDYPDFNDRGFMLDVSRCKVPKMDELYKFIDMLSILKYNQLQLYIEHTFAFGEHETVWHDSSPLTSEEIISIDLYCKECFIELVPNLNSFGHLERWLKYDEYRQMAECPNGFKDSFGTTHTCGRVIKPDAKKY